MNEATPETLLPLRPLVFDFLLLFNQQERHGYGLMQEQNERGGRQVLGPGTLYRTLREMQELGLIQPKNGADGGSKDRRYYGITSFGRQVAAAEAARMASLVGQAKEGRLLG
ncbi:MAG: helix-turn-helix transcriptional regulator [Gemmatimonadetes bacterium]|jgi:DNA-binding PadR family transcriptional regulator|nr:helix-turn-helix transcriptional regulator [Gemmatimonadota bacterium]